MVILTEIIDNLLLEQENKLEVLRKAISERIPISIYYSGPPNEVREGQRIDIEPIVLGTHAKSGNLVIWAFVFKGVSKRGLPGWKMFRVDRIKSAKYNNLGATNFKLGELPGYEKGKAPSAMKSLSSVEIFSPYWFDDKKDYTPSYVPPKEPEVKKPEPRPKKPLPPPQEVGYTPKSASGKVYNELRPKIRDINGQRVISQKDYDETLNNLSHRKEDQFKVYQRQVSGNERPGEGTRSRFNQEAKSELDNLLSKDNIQISDDPEVMAEGYRIQSRIKRLINW